MSTTSHLSPEDTQALHDALTAAVQQNANSGIDTPESQIQQQAPLDDHHHHHHQLHEDHHAAAADLQALAQQAEFPGGLEGIMSQEHALALQHLSAIHQGALPLITPPNFPRPTVKRRKPVKWETWEEKNLIEGVRRFGRGNWAQIRAAFEFNPCRTNVDLHDKWRVLTGERKRNRQQQRMASPASPTRQAAAAEQMLQQHFNAAAEVAAAAAAAAVQGDNQSNQNGGKLQGLVPYPLFDPNLPFPAELLQHIQQNELFAAQQAALQQVHDEAALHLEHPLDVHVDENDMMNQQQQQQQQPPRKRSKKSKESVAGDETEIAQELLKLAKTENDEEHTASLSGLEDDGSGGKKKSAVARKSRGRKPKVQQ